MNREEFIRQLEKLLGDISESERMEAIDYYNSYFDDAGSENEAQVIQELGSPGKVAAIIKADLAEDTREYGEYTEKGYEDSRMEDGHMPQVYGEKRSKDSCEDTSSRRARRGYKAPSRKNQPGNLFLIIAILVLSCWLWGPLLLGVGGVLIGVAVAVIASVLCLGIGGLCALITAVVFVGVGVIKCVTNPGLGLLEIAVGFAAALIGVLMILIFILIAVKFLPWFLRVIVDFGQKLLYKVKERGGASL